MLDFVRNKQKSILIKFAFGLIILSFIIGYSMLSSPGDRSSNATRSDIAARVNDMEISYSAFQQAYSNLYNLYQSIYQGNFNPEVEKQLNLPKQALEQLINETLLVQEAGQRGIEVSSKELIEAIAQYDAFKENGVFNRERYLQVLNYQRMTPEQFEATQQRQLLSDKVREQLQQGIEVSAAELEEAFHKENDKLNLNFVQLTPPLFEARVKVDDQDLQAYFEENQEDFRLPAKVSLRYLQFDPARYEKEVANFTEEELNRYYRRNLDLFEIKEEIKAAHILIRVPEEADDETRTKRREFAQGLLQQLKEGADFATLAKANSDDSGTAKAGGDLGRFGRGIMVNSFENAAFALRPGQLSEVTDSPFGFHIIRVDEYTEAGVKPLVDAIEEVKAGLLVDKARQRAYEKAMDAYNINRKSGDLETAAQSNDLGIKETGFFGRDDAIDGIGKVDAISAAAFSLQSGELARPVQTTQGIFLFTLKERRESRLPELAEVNASAEQAYRRQQAESLANETADKLLAQAQSMKSLRRAAAELKLTVEETGDFSRSFGAFVPRIGASEELAAEAFTLTDEAPIGSKVYNLSDKAIVFSLKKATPADFNALDEPGRVALRDQLLTSKKERMVSEKLQVLQKQAQLQVMVPELASAFSWEKE